MYFQAIVRGFSIMGVSFPITGSVYKIEKIINCSPRKVELINQKTKQFLLHQKF